MPERLNQAMDYIERHLDQDQPIEVTELARIAVTSECRAEPAEPS